MSLSVCVSILRIICLDIFDLGQVLLSLFVINHVKTTKQSIKTMLGLTLQQTATKAFETNKIKDGSYGQY